MKFTSYFEDFHPTQNRCCTNPMCIVFRDCFAEINKPTGTRQGEINENITVLDTVLASQQAKSAKFFPRILQSCDMIGYDVTTTVGAYSG